VPDVSSLKSRLGRERLIGKGLTSDVFSWGEGRVLKLYHPWMPAATAQREFTISRAIHGAGLPVPAVYEVIEVDGRPGIVFEHVHGHSLVKDVERKPWTLFAAARLLAELHARLHQCPAPAGLPSQRDQIAHWVNRAPGVSDEHRDKARCHLAQLPDGGCVCHGDFHPANILLTAKGPVIIDWSTATRGHPLADVARTSVLIESAPLPPETALHLRLLMKVSRRLLHAAYLKRYFELRPEPNDVEFWRVPQRMAGPAWRAERDAALKSVALGPG
jgi:uncharacterized protein (TIGR02172 family)